MLFYYVYVLSFCFYQRSFMDLFHIFMSSGIRRYLHVLSFCLLEGFKVSKVCFIRFRCSLSVFIKTVLWIFWFTFSGVQVSEFICQGFVVRGFFMVILFVKDLLSPEYFVCQKVNGLVVEGFRHVKSVRGFSIKRFLQVLFFLFLWVYMLCQSCCFFQVLYVCQSFGSQKVASGPLVWCVSSFKV